MRKKIGLFLAGGALLVLAGVFGGSAWANEGTVDLRPEPGKRGGCFAASVYLDGSYKVLVSCRDLPVALAPERNKYVLWREFEGKVSRLNVLSNGKLSATANSRFDRLFVTVEYNARANKPSEEVIASGDLRPLSFDREVGWPAVVTPTPTPDREVVGVTATPTVMPMTSGLVKTIKGIGRAVGLGFLLLLVVVGVLSFLARKRSL